MDDGTAVLLGLEDEFTVLMVERVDPGRVKAVIEVSAVEDACPGCGVLSSRVKDRPVIVVKDLKACGQVVDLCWRKRRLTCQESGCSRATFTRQSEQIPARSRVTARLRAALATAIARSNRAVSDVAAEHEVSWHTAHKALVAAATAWFPEPEPTRVLGIDETRARSVRWVLEEAGWKRSNPWMTSFVDADTTVPGRLLGLAPGRSGACVSDWLGEQSQEFRDGIELVVIDPSAPYASGVRRTLPNARIAVDKWHLVALANQMVTEVRQRVTRERLGRRGTTAERTWTHRQLLLTGYEHLSTKQVARLRAALAAEDLTNEIGAAHAVKERLRLLLNASDPARDQVPALRLLQRRRGLPHGRDRPAGQDDRHLVASHPDGADRRTATWTTTAGAYWPTSPSPEGTRQQHEQARPAQVRSPLKTEFYDRHTFTTHAEAIHAVSSWIETIYNRRRRHSALGQIPPVAFEDRTTAASEAA
jgi:transposase